MRLFIALEVPEDWRRIAADMAAIVAGAAPDIPMRFVDALLMHLTLRFLGEVANKRVDGLCATLAERVPPVDVRLTLGHAGTFGSPARTQVAWLGIGGDLDGLRALVRRVDLALQLIELAPADTRFAAHLTLLRLTRAVEPEQRRAVAEVIAALPPPPPLEYVAREVVLVHSTLGGRRPRYEIIGRFG